jgi:hypothetical protein
VFDFIVTAVFVIAAVLMLVVTIREWQATRHMGYILPAIAFGLAAILFIADPMLMAIPWLAGISWLLIGLVLRLIVRSRSHRQA